VSARGVRDAGIQDLSDAEQQHDHSQGRRRGRRGAAVSAAGARRGVSPVRRLREREWSPVDRARLIGVIAICMGSLFLITYSLALADPVPRGIDSALVGDATAHPRTVQAVQDSAHGKLDFSRYSSVPAALRAIDEQRVYAALDLTSTRPTLYVASAAGASVAHLLEGVSAVDPSVRIVDTHPLASNDPNGLDLFYRMLVATIIGFLTVFQVRAQAGPLPLRRRFTLVVGLAAAASLALTLVGGSLLHGFATSQPEEWGILALHVLAVSSFASLVSVLLGRWALLPTWLFFVILGNSSSGGAVSPPLLPAPFAFVSQWLPSGATVTSLRDAVYFGADQHVRPLAVLAVWATALFAAWIVVARRRESAAGRSLAAAP
jgi:hypothetical protein